MTSPAISSTARSETSPAKRKRGRPPKVDGHNRATRDRLVRAGIEVLTEQGFTSTGIDVVLKRVGVPKGSFYHYFDSKDDFGQAVIAGYAAYFANKLDRWLLDETHTPLARLQNFITDAKDGMARHHFRRGCLIGNMGQELGGTHDAFRADLEAVFVDWQSRLEACFILAQDAGEISKTANCAELAAVFWIGWEGAILRAKLMQSAGPMDLFATTFINSLQ